MKGMPMNDPLAHGLLSQRVDPDRLTSDGDVTRPRNGDVYAIFTEPPSSMRRFRQGNHPVRMKELEREFGPVRVVAVFLAKTTAKQLADHCNATRQPAPTAGADCTPRGPGA